MQITSKKIIEWRRLNCNMDAYFSKVLRRVPTTKTKMAYEMFLPDRITKEITKYLFRDSKGPKNLYSQKMSEINIRVYCNPHRRAVLQPWRYPIPPPWKEKDSKDRFNKKNTCGIESGSVLMKNSTRGRRRNL